MNMAKQTTRHVCQENRVGGTITTFKSWRLRILIKIKMFNRVIGLLRTWDGKPRLPVGHG